MSEPEIKIACFVCNWCTYAGADLAGTSRMQYAPNIRIIKIPCTARLDPIFLLKAFEQGVDAVWVSGCHPGDCHYISGNLYGRRRWQFFREALSIAGVDVRRVFFTWISAAEGGKFRDKVNEIVEKVQALGPYTEFHSILPIAPQKAPAAEGRAQ